MPDEPYQRRALGQSELDTRALEIAMEAKTIILQHQRTCDEDRVERRQQIEKLQTSLISSKEEVRAVINRGMIWFIGLLIVCMGYFLAVDGLPGHH